MWLTKSHKDQRKGIYMCVCVYIHAVRTTYWPVFLKLFCTHSHTTFQYLACTESEVGGLSCRAIVWKSTQPWPLFHECVWLLGVVPVSVSGDVGFWHFCARHSNFVYCDCSFQPKLKTQEKSQYTRFYFILFFSAISVCCFCGSVHRAAQSFSILNPVL